MPFIYLWLQNNKGALLALIWTFVIFSVVVHFTQPSVRQTSASENYSKIGFLFLPFAGFLSDVYLGRYRVIRYSMWLTWFSLVVKNILLIIQSYVWNSGGLAKIEVTVTTLTCVGVSGVIANIIQFGIDQLTHASSSDIISYIRWYAWTLGLANVFVSLTKCVCGIYSGAVSYVLLPLMCTLAVVSDFVLNHWLVKEPVLDNPFKLIYLVLKYAAKNKYPRLRSAFTYWEDKPFSRLDLGKAKYGGPFTTEQVENVKTFFRFTLLIFLSSAVAGLLFNYNNSHTLRMLTYRNGHNAHNCPKLEYISDCLMKNTVIASGFNAIVIYIPLLQFIILSLPRKCTCCVRVNFHHKIIISFALLLVYNIVRLVSSIVTTSVENHNVTCFLNVNEENIIQGPVIDIDYRWLVIPEVIYGLATYLLISSGIEFICAQAPYSMKGVLLGLSFFPTGICMALSKESLHWLQKVANNANLECDIWYNTAMLVLTIGILVIYIIFKRYYIYRIRDDVLSNDQMFAVSYFNKYLSIKQ